MQRATLHAAFLISCLTLTGCDKPIEYNHSSLGFANKAEMEAAFAKGYHTKQKLLEMTKAESGKPMESAPPKEDSTQPQAASSTDSIVAGSESPVKQTAIQPSAPGVPVSGDDKDKSSETPASKMASSADSSPFTPSFDCSKASNGQEKMVCADRDLSQLDVQMSQAYAKKRELVSDKDAVKKEQLNWIKFSLRACSDKPCLIEAYKKRIAELQ
jgi:uncharacterized protein YecT (DUF1311 family)